MTRAPANSYDWSAARTRDSRQASLGNSHRMLTACMSHNSSRAVTALSVKIQGYPENIRSFVPLAESLTLSLQEDAHRYGGTSGEV